MTCRAVFGALIATVFNLAPLRADPIDISAATLSRFALLTNKENFGALVWRGGLELTSPDKDFGGLSGLAMSEDCDSFQMVSDKGRRFTGDVIYQDGKLAGLKNTQVGKLRDAKGKKLEGKATADTEGLASLGNGRAAVAFERGGRVGIYDFGALGFKAPYVDAQAPADIGKGPFNGQLESVGYFQSGLNAGQFLAIAESHFDATGNTKAWVWSKKQSQSFSVLRYGEYLTTEVVVTPKGDMFFLERNIGPVSLPSAAIRYLPSQDITSGVTLTPRVIFEAGMPFHAIDNMEGIGFCTINGEERLTIVSDNNFNTTIQRTLLLQFAITQ